MKRKYQWISGFGFVVLSSCLPVEQQSDGQIVVVGNGAEWSDAVVVDVRTGGDASSLVFSDEGLAPVGSILSSENPNMSARLDWVANSPTGKTLLQVSSASQEQTETTPDLELESKEVIKTDASGKPEAENEFQKLDFSEFYPPLYLSDSSLLYVNSKNEMRWSHKGEEGSLIASKFDDFFITENGVLILQKKSKYQLVRLKDLKERRTDLTKEELSKFPHITAETVFVGPKGRIFYYSRHAFSEPLNSGIYEFDLDANKSTNLVLAGESKVKIEKFISTAFGKVRDRFVGLVQLEGGKLAVVEISMSGVLVHETTGELNVGTKVVAGPTSIAVLSDKVEVCQKGCSEIPIQEKVTDLIFNEKGNLVAAFGEEGASRRIEEFKLYEQKINKDDFVSTIDQIETDEVPLEMEVKQSIPLPGDFDGFRKFPTPPPFEELQN